MTETATIKVNLVFSYKWQFRAIWYREWDDFIVTYIDNHQ